MVTGRYNSGSYPAFGKAAGEIADKLLADYPGSADAARAASCLRHWAALFALWDDPARRPEVRERTDLIDDYLLVYRGSLDLIVRLAVSSRC